MRLRGRKRWCRCGAWRQATTTAQQGKWAWNGAIVPQLSLQPIRIGVDADGADAANSQAGGLGEAVDDAQAVAGGGDAPDASRAAGREEEGRGVCQEVDVAVGTGIDIRDQDEADR